MAGYASGIALSAAFDVPTGPLIVWALALVGVAHYALAMRQGVGLAEVARP